MGSRLPVGEKRFFLALKRVLDASYPRPSHWISVETRLEGLAHSNAPGPVVLPACIVCAQIDVILGAQREPRSSTDGFL